MGRRDDLDRFYTLLTLLEQKNGPRRVLVDEACRSGLPRRGVYFFFEAGEFREDGCTPRVVRVGTHAVSENAKTRLWSRLSQHRGRLGGPHAGGGNHRASVFRRHLGTALMGQCTDGTLSAQQWGSKLRPVDERLREAEHTVELAVSQYIRAMPFLWMEVDDPPSKQSHRKLIEANAIGLLSNRQRPLVDNASPEWLGHWASDPAIRESGLWNVDHVDDVYDPEFLWLLFEYISK